ncbi:tetraacyldisaccharide 4'-kinase [Desulfovibrio ferrophilus]|uniref:Tetraacyldisaccharide 4'-kinase n=1 Tax=Desulfovibrio ferrophilus TaxID=241368 RepID=A0A2Z6B0Q6_9BACT|nr:tetraacyldisaccharide 4'-kinase [Desulfovibrio ferrophilus]BBD08986.1 tetraacyldisaccharide 4'-kinase [Desulfovibrio ferrophilus]
MHNVTPLQRKLFPLLYLPSRLYAMAMRLRRQWYESGALTSYKPERPTISIGNICWGGTGKTPLTEWIVQWAINEGLTPAVLTRGYKSIPPELPYLVHEQSTAREAGDEPLLLAKSCPEAHVVVDPQRARAAKWIAKHHNPDLYLLDDGFQHLGIERHLDLVLLRPQDLTEDWNRVIPSGPWREGEEALTRTAAFLIKAPQDDFQALEPFCQEFLAQYKAPVFPFTFSPKGLTRLDRSESARGFGDEPYLLVSGVGEHEQVQRTAEELLGHPPIKHLRFDDHYNYQEDDWKFIREKADLANAERVLCTGKDAVKLVQFNPYNLWTFDHTLDFGPGLFTNHSFPDWWRATWPLL